MLSPDNREPKLDTFSLNAPITVNCNPWILTRCRPPPARNRKGACQLPVTSATFWRSVTSLESRKRPARITRLRTGILLVGAVHLDVPLRPLTTILVKVHDAGGGDDPVVELAAHGFDVGNLQVVGGHLRVAC